MRNKKIIDPAQKFFEQLMTGVARNEGTSVYSISALPVSASTVSKKIFRKYREKCNEVNFIYPAFINGKFLRFLTVYLSSFFIALRLFASQKNKNDVFALCDPLNLQVSKAVHLAARLCGVKSIAVVTDIPYWATEMKAHNYSFLRRFFQKKYESLCTRELVSYDAYINLTSFMNPIANPRKRPNIVIEGSVDIDVVDKTNETKKIFPFIMYAGGVYEKYGIGMLVKGFIKANLESVKLKIYGTGSYVPEIQRLSKDNPNVEYAGVALNTDLPEIESSATLLVNPRFTGEEYTKFSFPSKTLEYMSSGTPVLSTRLAGIPKDYDPYIYWLDDETEEGMAAKLQEIFIEKNFALAEMGRSAKAFVAENKNNVSQGKKIVEFAMMIRDK